MQQRTIAITAAQINTLHTVPVEIVAHPGAGIVLTPWAVTTVFHGNGVAHTGGGDVSISVGAFANGHEFVGISQATLQATVDMGEEQFAVPETTPTGVLAQFEDQPLMLTAAGADFAAAGGTATVTVFYNSSRIT